ncbi:fibronectin type III domain-containing protein [Candidatus Poribacteria bacterium]|nr:fibronectin type III domain-containing protein [Candidatus Poribacteria bacterium]
MKIIISLLILMSLLITEAVAQLPAPGPPIGLRATPGDRQFKLTWTHPSGISVDDIDAYKVEWYDSAGQTTGDNILWENSNPTVVEANPHHTFERRHNGTQYIFKMRVYMKSTAGYSDRNGAFSPLRKVTPMMPAPTDFTATLDAPTTGSRTVTLSWTAIPQLPFTTANRDVTDYEYSQNGGASWTSTGSTSTTKTVSGLQNGRSYAFRVRGVRASEVKGLPSRTVVVRPLIDAPGSPGTLNVQRDEDTATLTWSPPSDEESGEITRYEYSDDGGSTWQSTGSTATTYTVTGLEAGETYTFLVRAVYVDGTTSRIISPPSRSSNAVVISLPKPKRRIVQDCPVGWVRSDRFAGRNRRVLIYEVKLDMNLQNRTSIYQPDWVAIYVHPDEALENLEGWKLQVAVPYNHHREYLLTAENSVVVDAGFVEGGFAFIANPEENPFPMTGVGFTGSPAPGFDYRLYDDTGRRIDFGISCYKRFDIFQVLKDLEDPRVLRNVSLKDIDWNASWFIRSEWTVPAVGLYPKIGRSGL